MPTPAPHHDRVHEPRDHPRWRESYYFSFFDDRLGFGGFSSIGKRPARGHSGSINAIWGPDRPTLFAAEYDTFDRHEDVTEVTGLSYASEQPFGPWRLAFDGMLNDGGDAVELDHAAFAPAAKSDLPSVPVRYDLEFAPDAPPYLYEERAEWHDLFDGHVDEVGRVTGTVVVDGTEHEVDCRGAKDHSWGVREWFGVEQWRWMDLVAASSELPELTMWRASFDGDAWIGDGAAYVGGRTEAVEDYDELVTWVERPRKPMPATIEASFRAGDRRTAFSGEVLRVVPMLFGRDHDGGRETAWVDKSLVRCRVDGVPAWGNIEFEGLVRE